jgi:hypothetical protein
MDREVFLIDTVDTRESRVKGIQNQLHLRSTCSSEEICVLAVARLSKPDGAYLSGIAFWPAGE